MSTDLGPSLPKTLPQSGHSPGGGNFLHRQKLKSERASTRGENAYLLAQILGEDSPSVPWLKELERSSAKSFTEAFFSLPAPERQCLLRKIGERELHSFLALSEEPDLEMFLVNLLDFARRQEETGKENFAASIYAKLVSFLADSQAMGLNQELRTLALQRLDALLGRGPVENRFEALLSRWMQETTDPAGLIAMAAGACTFRLTRFLALKKFAAYSKAPWIARGMGPHVAANLGAFLAEISAFTSVNKGVHSALGKAARWDSWIHDLGNTALLLGPLKLMGKASSSLYARTLKITGGAETILERGSRILFPQAGMLSGLMLGHFLEEAVGMKPPQAGEMHLVDSLATLLHFNIAGTLSARLFGGSLQALEREVIQLTRKPPGENSSALVIDRAPDLTWVNLPMAMSRPKIPPGNPPSSETLTPPSPLPWKESQLRRRDQGQAAPFPTPAQAEALTRKFRTQFPEIDQGVYSDQVIASALATPSEQSDFHLRLLEAYASVPDRGTLSQLYTAKAIEYTMDYDAAHSSTGSFDNALMQIFLRHALKDPSPQRNARMQDLFAVMEAGLTRPAMETLLQSSGADRGWGFKPSDLANPLAVRILGEGRKAGHYDPLDIDLALNYARSHPLGKLVLQRVLYTLASGDIPAKLRELRPQSANLDLFSLIQNFESLGWNSEQIAEAINNTHHTGHIEDMRLARKVVSWAADVAPLFSDPKIRQDAFQRFYEGFLEIARTKGSFGVPEYLDLLRINSGKEAESLLKAHQEGKITIKLLASAHFDQEAGSWSGRSAALLDRLVLPDRVMDRILIQDFSPYDLRTGDGLNKAFSAVTYRLNSLLHEFEHWRHFGGYYEGMEIYSNPIEAENISRQDRLVSETMSFLEEQRWSMRNLDVDYWQLAQRRGESLALYYRNHADSWYFGRENRKLARSLRKFY